MKKLLLPTLLLCALPALAQQQPVVEISTTYANQASAVNTYDSEFKLRKPGSDLFWTAKNFSNNSIGWPNIRCGSKTEATTATITSDFAIENPINRIDVNITRYADGSTNSMTSMDILISPNADMSDAIVYPADISNLPDVPYIGVPSNISVSIAEPLENMYYQLRIEMPKVSTSGPVAVDLIQYFEPAPDAIPGNHSANINFSDPEELLKCYTGEKEIAPGSSYATTDETPNNLNGTTYAVNGVKVTISKGDNESASMPRWYESTGNLKIAPELRMNVDNVMTFEITDEDLSLVEVQFVQGTSAESYFNNIDSTTAETNLGKSSITNKTWKAPAEGRVNNLTLTFHGYCRCTGINIVTHSASEEEIGTGIQTVSADSGNAPVEYFTISGQRTLATRPGLYIKRQGSTATKILIK